MPTDLTSLNGILQTQNQILQRLIGVLQAGVLIDPAPQSFTVATLPTTGVSPGQMAWAADGRKSGEGAGVGTGLPVYWNSATSQWFTVWGNALVTS